MNLHKEMSNAQKRELINGQYDIGLFQEWCEKSEPFYDFTEYEQHSTYNLKRFFSRQQCGTTVLLRHKADLGVREAYHFLSQDKEFLINKPKAITAVYMEPDVGKRLLVISVHGHNGWPKHKKAPLQRQLYQLQQLLNETQCPTILAGDFNTFTEDRKAVMFEFVRTFGFKVYESAAFDEKKTLDYVFASNGITIDNFKIKRGLSDHPAMAFTIKL
jgi:endonuclease/exonuclease/phosphatase (EEP) superfamily protein YafD